MTERDRTKAHQVQAGENTTHVTPGTDYTDGYRVTVGWSDEDDAWIAECSGISTGDCIGHGNSKELALLSLCCSLAATVDAVNDPKP